MTRRAKRVVIRPVELRGVEVGDRGTLRVYWPERYAPFANGDGREYIPEPYFESRPLMLPRYLETKGRGYSLITPGRRTKAVNWLATHWIIIKQERKR